MGMLGEICKELNNYFVHKEEDRVFGTFTISNGVLSDIPAALTEGRYYRIAGSVFNDGVYQHPATVSVQGNKLTDETFDGSLWLMSVPPDFLALVQEIETWANSDEIKKAVASPYSSESFGGYSYSKGSGNASDGDNGVSWQNQFASKLNKWRKVSPL